jgi:anti-sigma B factor antagonist
MAEVDKKRSIDGKTTGTIVSVEASSDPSGVPVLAISGELDLSSAGSVRQAVERVTAEGPDKVIFDLGGLQFMDSTGIAILVIVAEQVETVEVRNPSKMIRRIIEISGLMGTLRITP